MLRKNTSGQNLSFCLVNATTGAALTGATVTARRTIDGGAQATAGGSVTELGNGQYNFAPSQADTNGDLVGYLFTATNAIPVNLAVRTTAADLADAVRLGLTALPNAASGSAGAIITSGTGTAQLSVTSGVVVANVTQFGGSNGTFSSGRPEVNATHWAGTAVASAHVRANLTQILGTAPTEGASGRLAGAFTTLLDVASPVLTAASVNQTGDAFARIGSTGSGLTSLAPAATALSTATWTGTRAGYLDNLSAGAVATAAALSAVDDFVDTEVAAIKAVTDKLDTALELDSTVYRFTANALEQAPTGGGGGLTAADVWAHGTRTLTAGTNIVLAKGTGVTGFNDLDAAGVAGAVWNATTASYGTAGTYGELVETRLPAALVGGRMDVSVGAYQSGLAPPLRLASGTATGGTSTTLTIGVSAAYAGLVGAVLRLTGGPGAPQEAVIVAYNLDSGVATVSAASGAWAAVSGQQPGSGTTWEIWPAAGNTLATGIYTAHSGVMLSGTATQGVATATAVNPVSGLPGSLAAAVHALVPNELSGYTLDEGPAGWPWVTRFVPGGVSAGTPLAVWQEAVGARIRFNTGEYRTITAVGLEGGYMVVDINAGIDGGQPIQGDYSYVVLHGLGTGVWDRTPRVLTSGQNIVLAKGTGVTGFNDVSPAQVNAEVDAALADARLDELLAADSDIDGAAPPAVGSVFHELMSKTSGSFTYDQTTDSLEAVRDRGDAAWVTATGFSTHSAADVWAHGTRTLTGAANITSTGGTITVSAGAVTVGTNSDKTGYSLAADQQVDVAKWGGTAVASANVRANLTQVLGTGVTEGGSGRLAASLTTLLDVATPAFTVASANQTGDAFARIGANGAGLTSLASATNLAAVAGYLDTEIAAILENTGTTLPAQIAALPFPTNFGSLSVDGSGRVLLQPTQTGVTIPTVTAVTNRVAADVERWRAGTPGTLDANGFVPANAAAVNGNTTRAVTLSTWLDNDRLDAAVTTRASQTSVNTLAGYVDTEVAAVKAVTDKLDTALELDGAVYRFTANALEQTPTGGLTAADVWAHGTRTLTSLAGLTVDTVTAVTNRVTANTDRLAGQTVTATAGVTFPAAVGTSTYAGADTAGTATLLARLTETRAGHLDGLAGGVPTAAAVAGAVWDEPLAGHAAAGTAGKLLADAAAGVENDGMTVDTVLLTVSTPSGRLTDAAGNPLTQVTVGQALTALLAAVMGDRDGVGTRQITAAIPGVAGASVTATRVSSRRIESATVVPAAGD